MGREVEAEEWEVHSLGYLKLHQTGLGCSSIRVIFCLACAKKPWLRVSIVYINQAGQCTSVTPALCKGRGRKIDRFFVSLGDETRTDHTFFFSGQGFFLFLWILEEYALLT